MFAKDGCKTKIVSLFILSVAQDFAPICSLVLGGRLDGAYAITRRNLEILGMSRIITYDEDASLIWANAHDDEASWKKFKNTFSIKCMFLKGDALWDKMFELYDDLAREHHSNPRSFSRIKEHSRSDTQVQFEVSNISFDPEEFRQNAQVLWLVIYISSMILLGFSRIVFDTYQGEKRKELSKVASDSENIMKKAWDKMITWSTLEGKEKWNK